jgi:phosphatidylserine decarboxylase
MTLPHIINHILDFTINKYKLNIDFDNYKKIVLCICDYVINDETKETITKQLFPIILPLYPVNYYVDKNKFIVENNKYNDYKSVFLRKYKIYKFDSCNKVSPVDGLHIETNNIKKNKMFINEIPIDLNKVFNSNINLPNNYCYDIMYLTYKDYHYVHFPFDCKILSITNIPGKYLWMEPQIEFGCKFLGENHRKIYKLLYDNTDVCYLVMIASIIVGGINTIFYNEENVQDNFYTIELANDNIYANKGDFLANFYIGSMVCMIYPSKKSIVKPFSLTDRVQMGKMI